MKRPIRNVTMALLFTFLSCGRVSFSFECLPVNKPEDNAAFPDFPKIDDDEYFLNDFEKADEDEAVRLLARAAIPHDVATPVFGDLRDRIEAGELECISTLSRLFDIFSWQSFLAVNWPIDEQRKPRRALTDLDTGVPRWLSWNELHEVFRGDGTEPVETNTGSLTRSLPVIVSDGKVKTLFNFVAADPALVDKRRRLLLQLNAISSLSQFSPEVLIAPSNQTSKKKLWDQQGNVVYYETLMNTNAFKLIEALQLYNLPGQHAADQQDPQGGITFNKGDYKPGTVEGAIMLKLAWKVITDKDNVRRFYIREAYIPGPVSSSTPPETYQKVEKITVGLVGLHILHKTLTAPEWVWSSFEHIDNLTEDPEMTPLFYKRDCSSCEKNVENKSGTQVVRELPLPTENTKKLNAQIQTMLKQMGSVWQYYQLVGTQYQINFKPGKPSQRVPEKFTNPVLETYQQSDSCLSCHEKASLAQTGKAKTADFVFSLGRAHEKLPAP